MAQQQAKEQEAKALRYRTVGVHRRNGKNIPPGTLITPTEKEMAAFPDKFERVQSVEELRAEQEAQIAKQEAALAEKKKALASAA